MTPGMNEEHYLKLLDHHFPELEIAISSSESPTCPMSLESLAFLTDNAHRAGDTAFLNRSYPFIRWSIRNVESEQLKGWIADWFFDFILLLEHSKTRCLGYLDWGDVDLLTSNFTDDPMFEDSDNFERLCKEWRKRWSRNQKLPPPKLKDLD